MVNEWFGPNIIDFLMAELNSRDHVINIAAKLGTFHVMLYFS